MRHLFLFFMLSIVTSAYGHATETLMVLGDSLSAGYGLNAGEGWVELLQKKVLSEKKDWKIINSSISGDTTQNGLLRLPAALAMHKPQRIIIELGGNDGLRGTAPSVIKQNLKNLVVMAQQSGAKVYVMEMVIPYNYGKKYVDTFIKNYREIAQETGATLIPFFLQGVALQDDMMQADGIHPNAKAQPLMMAAVYRALR